MIICVYKYDTNRYQTFLSETVTLLIHITQRFFFSVFCCHDNSYPRLPKSIPPIFENRFLCYVKKNIPTPRYFFYFLRV